MARLRLTVSVILGSLAMVAMAAPAAAALPVKDPPCGKVVKASFKLKNDMVCTGDALIVGRSGITIHLNGKQLSGDGDVNDFGVENAGGFDGVLIRSGRITGFEDGIRIEAGARRNVVHRIRAFGNTSDGIDIESGRGHLVRKSVASGNGDDGVDIEGGRLHGVHDTLVQDNASDGIDMESSRSSLLDNEARNNGSAGIEFIGQDNVVKRNHACGNVGGNYDKSGTFTFKKNTQTIEC